MMVYDVNTLLFDPESHAKEDITTALIAEGVGERPDANARAIGGLPGRQLLCVPVYNSGKDDVGLAAVCILPPQRYQGALLQSLAGIPEIPALRWAPAAVDWQVIKLHLQPSRPHPMHRIWHLSLPYWR